MAVEELGNPDDAAPDLAEDRVSPGNSVLPQSSADPVDVGSALTPVSGPVAGADPDGAGSEKLTPLPRWAIGLLIAATFGSGMAMIVPMAFSLAVQLEALAPGRTELLGVILGVGSAATLVLAPLTGILSDRTRSRWGRRRPFTVIGLLIGVASVPVMVFAPNVGVLGLGWVMSTVGWGTTGASIGNWQADRLPPSQRAQLSGATGLMMQISPVVGIVMVTPVRDQIALVFALPAIVAVVTVVLFVVFARDPDSRHVVHAGRLTPKTFVASLVFRPRDAPDFAWNWLGRFVFFLGLTLTTTFSVFFVAQRLNLSVADVAGVLALTASLSIVTATLGSIGGGWLSDRIARRKPLILAGAALFAAGCAISAFAHDLGAVVAGTLVSSLGIALFSAVGQALVLDVLPDRATQAGRYMAITLFAQKIPGVIAPLSAPLLLGMGSDGQNFTALYLAAAVLALAGGSIIAAKVHGVR